MPAGTPVKQKKRSKSVLKNMRQAERRTAVNQANRTRVRTAIKKLRAALAAGDAEGASRLLGTAFAEVDRGVRKRVLRENTANRYKSRLSVAVNALRAAKKG